MKKKLFALSGVFLIVLVVTGLWATRATDLLEVLEQNDPIATSMVNVMSVKDMTEGASLIVIGNCLDTRSQWTDGRLVTLATISVTQTIKGDEAQTLTVVLPGGIDSNRKHPVAMTYPGAPRIAPEEELFLFLTTQDEVENGYTVMGFAQGKFSIAKDTENEKVVTLDATIAPMERGAGLRRGNPQAVRLREFIELVRSYLN